MRTSPVSVIEVARYQRQAEEILTANERHEVVDVIAYNPFAGDLIPGTGGLRKLRVGREDIGKRGGARVIYYFYNEDHPAYLLTIFAKNRRSDLSPEEKRQYSELVKDIVALWKKQ